MKSKLFNFFFFFFCVPINYSPISPALRSSLLRILIILIVYLKTGNYIHLIALIYYYYLLI